MLSSSRMLPAQIRKSSRSAPPRWGQWSANRRAATPASYRSRLAAPLRREPPGKGVPGMKTTRLARRLGLDGNPLRRRTDKIAACFAAAAACDVLDRRTGAVDRGHRLGRPCRGRRAAGRRARGIRFPPSCCRPRRRPPSAEKFSGYSQVQARWTAPDGRARTGAIPVSAGLAAGHTVPLWVDDGGLADRSSAEPPCGAGSRGRRGGRCHWRAGDRAVVPGVGRAVGA